MVDECKIYVHIGHNKFDVNLFKPISNRDYFCKPDGGLWASPVDSDNGWEQWCTHNDYNKSLGFNKYGKDRFYFKLKPNAKLLYIDSVDKLNLLPEVVNPILEHALPYKVLDFDLLKTMYDAIELSISSDYNLYYELYGWDVDSILIMNPNCIISSD